MKVNTFGDKPATAMVQMALGKTSEKGARKYPRAVLARNHRICKIINMDDICISVPKKYETEELSSDVNTILADGNYVKNGGQTNLVMRYR